MLVGCFYTGVCVPVCFICAPVYFICAHILKWVQQFMHKLDCSVESKWTEDTKNSLTLSLSYREDIDRKRGEYRKDWIHIVGRNKWMSEKWCHKVEGKEGVIVEAWITLFSLPWRLGANKLIKTCETDLINYREIEGVLKLTDQSNTSKRNSSILWTNSIFLIVVWDEKVGLPTCKATCK